MTLFLSQTVASHPFSWEIPVEFAQMEHEKTTLGMESGFSVFIFVRYADFINCQIVKLLKSPNGANTEGAVLIAGVLTAIEEILEPRVVAGDLRRTPIVEIRKTSNI